MNVGAINVSKDIIDIGEAFEKEIMYEADKYADAKGFGKFVKAWIVNQDKIRRLQAQRDILDTTLKSIASSIPMSAQKRICAEIDRINSEIEGLTK